MNQSNASDDANTPTPPSKDHSDDFWPDDETVGSQHLRQSIRGLTIADLMLITLVTAFCLWAVNYFYSFPGRTTRLPNPPWPIWQFAFALQLGSSLAIPLACTLMIVSRRISQGSRWHLQPGHLLIALALATSAIRFATIGFASWFNDAFGTWSHEPNRSAVYFFAFLVLSNFFFSALVLWGIIESRHWYRAAFGSMLLMAVCGLLRSIFTVVVMANPNFASLQSMSWVIPVAIAENIFMWASIVLLIIAAVLDLRSGMRRDGFHWIGVINFIVQPIALQLMFTSAMRIFGPAELFGP